MKLFSRAFMRKVDTVRRGGRERTSADMAREMRRYPKEWCGHRRCPGHAGGGSCR